MFTVVFERMTESDFFSYFLCVYIYHKVCINRKAGKRNVLAREYKVKIS